MSKLLKALQGVEAPKMSLREIRGSQYKAVQIQPSRAEKTDYAKSALTAVTTAAQGLAAFDANMERRGQKRRDEILSKIPREDLKKYREDGTLLYNDDRYAMRALERELGRQEVYNVDAMITERISRGDFETREDMEKERESLTQKSMKEMSATFGMPEGGTEWFQEGYRTDITDRNMGVYSALSKKLEERARNESRLVVNNNISDIVKSGAPSSGIIKYVEKSYSEGIIRNSTEKEVAYVEAIKSLTKLPHGLQAVTEMLDSEVELFGAKTTLRGYFGTDMSEKFELTAANKVLDTNWEYQQDFTQKIGAISYGQMETTEDVIQARSYISQLEEQLNTMQGDMATPYRQRLEQAKAAFEANLAKSNTKEKEKLKAKAQVTNRVRDMSDRVFQYLGGELGVSFNLESFEETEATGKFEQGDWINTYKHVANKIEGNKDMTEAQKQVALLKVGRVLKSEDKAGFGAIYNAQIRDIGREVDSIIYNHEQGVEPPSVPTLDKWKALYQSDPKSFMEVMGEDGETAMTVAYLANAAHLNPAVVLTGIRNEKEMLPEQRTQKFTEFMNAMSNIKHGDVLQRLPHHVQKMASSFYSGVSGTSSEKATVLTEWLDSTYINVGSGSATAAKKVGVATGVVRRELLQVDANDPNSVEAGAATLSEMALERFKGGTHLTVTETNAGALMVSNGRGVPYIISKQMLTDKYTANRDKKIADNAQLHADMKYPKPSVTPTTKDSILKGSMASGFGK